MIGILLVVTGNAILDSCTRIRVLTNNYQQVNTTKAVTLPEFVRDWKHLIYIATGTTLLRASLQPEARKRIGFPFWLVDDLRALGLMETRFHILIGDGDKIGIDVPHFGKVRAITGLGLHGKRTNLLPMNIHRQYDEANFDAVRRYDVPFDRKQAKLVWRGTTTGYANRPSSRFECVSRWFANDTDAVDVAFSGIVQEHADYRRYVAPGMNVSELLSHKYLLSLEGNDVASGLAWQLLSNSVVFLPPLRYDSWLLDTHLEPYVHFIPVRPDFADLKAQVEWANAHPDRCLAIIEASTAYANMVWHNTIFAPDERHRVIQLSIGAAHPPACA